MATAANIVINDGQATPVATTFAPESINPSAWSVFADRTTGISMAYRRLKMYFAPATGKSKVNRSRLNIEIPVTSTVNGVTTLAYTLRANTELILPDGCTSAQRNDLYAFLKNALANALVQGELRDYDPAY